MSNGRPVDVHWTGGTIPSGQRILMANLDMSALKQLLASFPLFFVRFAFSIIHESGRVVKNGEDLSHELHVDVGGLGPNIQICKN